jgi:hypothetical protein
MDLNAIPIVESDLEQRVDLAVLSNFVLRLSQAGMARFPNEELQTFLLDAAGLPQVRDPRALQAAGLLDDEFDLQDVRQQAPPPPSNLDKMLLASLANRVIRHQDRVSALPVRSTSTTV